MKSETLRNLRTMRQIQKSGDIYSAQIVKTTRSWYGLPEKSEVPELQESPQFKMLCEKERKRFALREKSVERARGRLLDSRRKLSVIVSRNKALTKLRKKLQDAKDGKDACLKEPPPLACGDEEYSLVKDVNCLEIRY